MNRQITEDLLDRDISLYDTTMADTRHCTFVQTHRMYNIKSEL